MHIKLPKEPSLPRCRRLSLSTARWMQEMLDYHRVPRVLPQEKCLAIKNTPKKRTNFRTIEGASH